MRLATWNLNGMRARLDFLLLWLQERQPDLVGVQELKLTDELVPHDALAAVGYGVVSHGQKAWNGVAVLSRNHAHVRQRGLPGQDDLGARLLTAEVDGVAFTTVYCPNGKSVSHADYPAKLAWFDALADHLRQRQPMDEPAVLCGDFNITPAGVDSWNERGLAGSIHHTVAERDRFRALVGLGLRDVFRDKYPDMPGFSWWDYRGGAFHKQQGLRIDALLLTAPLAARVTDVWVDRDWRKKRDELTASDHAPVIVDLG